MELEIIKQNKINMKKEEIKIITKLDYAKLLIEDNKLGEAFDEIKEANSILEHKVTNIVNESNNKEINIPKHLTKTKAKEWVCINEIWYKIKNITKEQIIAEISKGNEVTLPYKIIKK